MKGLTVIQRRCVTCKSYKEPNGSRKVKDGYRCAECVVAREVIEMQQEVAMDVHFHTGDRPECRECGYHKLNPMAHFQDETGLRLKVAKSG